MDQDEMLKEMCKVSLSQADIKPICKIRGFPPACLKSRELFQFNFLAATGIEETMASLNESQVLFLHLLNAEGKEKDITFFTRLYEQAYPRDYGYTFNDKYKVVFKKVKTELIRKGLLLYAEEPKGWSNTTVLERQRFIFPTDFAAFLPLPVSPVDIAEPGDRIKRKDVLRDKLAEILEPDKTHDPKSDSVDGRLHIKDGQLLLGKGQFTVKRLKSWKRSQWSSSVTIDRKSGDSSLSPVALINYALSFLKEREWAVPDDVLPLWKMAFPAVKNLPDVAAAYKKGFKCGCLEKIITNGKTLFRSLKIDTDTEKRKPEHFLTIKNDNFFTIDLSCIPLDTLEWLSEICNMSIKQGELAAQPDLVEISHALEKIADRPTFGWLQKHHDKFRRTVSSIKGRKGKTVVHDNLLIARVRDLSLKVLLEKKFADTKKLVSLSDEFISFPIRLFPEIQKAVTKSGHAVKLIDTDA